MYVKKKLYDHTVNMPSLLPFLLMELQLYVSHTTNHTCVVSYCLTRTDNKYSEPERSCGVISLLGVSQNRGVTSGAVTSWPQWISLQPIQLPAVRGPTTLELSLDTQVLLVLLCGGVEAVN